jgi:hypothetical protein
LLQEVGLIGNNVDLNVTAYPPGTNMGSLVDTVLRLRGPRSIVGRSVCGGVRGGGWRRLVMMPMLTKPFTTGFFAFTFVFVFGFFPP